MEKIIIMILCFTLLFVAFNPDTLDPSIYDTVDGYRQLYLSSSPDSSYELDDLWIDPAGNMYLCIKNCSGTVTFSDWILLSKDSVSDNEAFSALFETYYLDPDCITQSDGKVEFWYTDKDPSGFWHSEWSNFEHELDRWYNTSSYTEYEWRVLWNEDVSLYSSSKSTFNDIFAFGYTLTFGTVKLLGSIFEGSDAFSEEFSEWRDVVLGGNTIKSYIPIISDIDAFLKKWSPKE